MKIIQVNVMTRDENTSDTYLNIDHIIGFWPSTKYSTNVQLSTDKSIDIDEETAMFAYRIRQVTGQKQVDEIFYNFDDDHDDRPKT